MNTASPGLCAPSALPYQKHSSTSKAAAISMEPKAGTMRRKVYDEFVRRGSLGATDTELQIQLGMNPSTQRPRRIELVRDQWIIDSGYKRETPSGRKAVVWYLLGFEGSNPNEPVSNERIPRDFPMCGVDTPIPGGDYR